MYRIDPDYPDPTPVDQRDQRRTRRSAAGTGCSPWSTSGPICSKVVPDYPATGKRILQDDGSWLRCLQAQRRARPNRHRAHRPRRSPHRGRDPYPADVICYATGFRHNDFLARMEVTGRQRDLAARAMGDEPTAYLGITMPNFPNLFCIYGPGTNLADGASLFYHAEFQVHYALEAIHETLLSRRPWIEVTPEAHDDYADRYQKEISGLVWSHPSIPQSLQERTARSSRFLRGRSTILGMDPPP